MKSSLISRRFPGRYIFFLLLGPLAVYALTGCHSYHWSTEYQSAEDYARQEKKYLFIFYKWWLSNDSNRMHGDVISDQAVVAHLKGMVSVLLEKDSSPDYGRYLCKYGVTEAPAFVIVAPDGSYQVRTGFIPKDRFIEFIESAKTPRPSRPGGRGPAAGSYGPVIAP